jgi:predicted dehydrogenase
LTERAEHDETTGRSPLRIALVGYGRWGTNVARDLAGTDGAELTHIVDTSAQALSRAARAHPSAVVALRLADVVDAVDAVAVCTPPATHAALAGAALEASKHVFVEKPFAMSERDAERLEALSTARGRVLMVGHQMLYHRSFETLCRRVASGELGALRAVHSARSGTVDAARDPGVLWAYGPHDVAMILELVGGPPSAIRASGSPLSRLGDVSITLEFAGGIVSTTALCGRAPARVRRLTAICARGEIVFDESVPHRDGDGAELPLARELEDFVACALAGARPRSDGRHGREVTRVLVGAERLLADGRPATSSFRWSRALS